MAMDKTRLGTALKAAVLALNPNADGMSGAENAQLQAYMEAIADEVIKEITTHAQINLLANDISVLPGSFTNPAGPVTGTGLNAPGTIAEGRIS